MRFFCADSTNIKIRFPFTLYIHSVSTIKGEPKTRGVVFKGFGSFASAWGVF